MKGVSQLLSFVITVLISVAAISVFTFAINPTLQRIREDGYVNQAFNSMKALSSLLEDIATEGVGSSRQMGLDVPAGTYFVKNDTDSVEYLLVAGSEVLPNGTNITRDNIRFISTQVAGRNEVEIKLVYSNTQINVTNYERFPQGSYSICIRKVDESSGISLIEVKSC